MKAPQPAVSVCMPVYNASRYLRECIDSVLSQTFADFEFLIVDDGSYDDSAAIVESYADPRIRLIRREHGYIASLNCLLDEARGRYIARMDADDVMLPDRLRLQFDYMEAHPDVDVLGGGAITIDEESKAKQNQEGDAEYTDWQITLKDLVEMNRLTHPTVCMRMETLRRRNASYEEEYIYAEDYRLWSVLARGGARIMVLSVPVLLYRESSGQVSARHYEVMRNTAQLISYENRTHLAELANQGYIEPVVAESERKLTVIIPFLNEGDEVVNTVASVREFAGDSVDVIVINDFSYDGIDYGELLRPYGVYYYVNFEHKGVAASRDFGVEHCRTPYFLLLDAHMRFYEAEVFKTITEMLDADDRQLLCCQSTAIMPDPSTGKMVPREDYPLAYGAYIPMKIGTRIPDIDWKKQERLPNQSIEDIPVVLGAGYAASRQYWQYLKGLEGLLGYGSDEVYISLKVWFEGGRCVLLKKHILGHYYRSCSPYLTDNVELMHNSLLIAELLLPDKLKSYCYASAMVFNYRNYSWATQLLKQNNSHIEVLRNYYSEILTQSYRSFETINATELNLRKQSVLDSMNEHFSLLIGKRYDNNDVSLLSGIGFAVLSSAMWWKITTDTNIEKLFHQKFETYVYTLRTNRHIGDSFVEGHISAGWLMLYLYKIGCIDSIPSDIIHKADKACVGVINQWSKPIYSCQIGYVLCYTLGRLYLSEFIEMPSSELLTVELLTQLESVARTILNKAGFSFCEYVNAIEFLRLLYSDSPSRGWVPDVRDWLPYEKEEPQTRNSDNTRNQSQDTLWLKAAANLLKQKYSYEYTAI